MSPIEELKSVVDQMYILGLDPLHLHIDGCTPLDQRPGISLWARTRTDFERICEAFGATPVERRYAPAGQRQFYAEHDTHGHRLLIQCVSFVHHHDWMASPTIRGTRLLG